jgi:ABC-type bacteriocin/lantibiotic exporter with double-glycine peptidase domain
MRLKDGILPTKRTDLVPRDKLWVTLVKVIISIACLTAMGFAVLRFSDKPLVLVFIIALVLILVLSFWIPHIKRTDRSNSETGLGD